MITFLKPSYLDLGEAALVLKSGTRIVFDCSIRQFFNKSTTSNTINSVSNQFYSNVKTKEIVESPLNYNMKPDLHCVPESMRMDFSRILNKPFLITAFEWTTLQTGLFEEIKLLNFPSDIFTNYLASVPFKSSSLYRVKMCLLLQVAGTPMHQGLLVAGSYPNGIVSLEDPNQILPCPHVFLNANESSSVCLEIPFFSPMPLMRTSNETGDIHNINPNFASVSVRVLNTLVPSAGASTTLTVSAHVVFKEADFYVPKPANITWEAQAKESQNFMSRLLAIPTKIFDGLAGGAKAVTGDFIDSLRVGARELTGFHNPNDTTINMRMINSSRVFSNNIDQPNQFERLDQHAQYRRIVQDYVFDTDQDEMDIKYILSKPAYIGKFKIVTTDEVGYRLFSQPISPFIEDVTTFFSPMRTLFHASRYWSGGLKMHIQSVMTNFQYCKLLVVRNYMCNNNALTTYPNMADTVNLMTETLEFSAGGQIQTIDLPYCSALEQLECSKYIEYNALMHGIVHIYVIQPLTTNGTAPTEAEFNVYFSAGDDFTYYGYANDPVNVVKAPLPPIIAENLGSLDAQRKLKRWYKSENLKLAIKPDRADKVEMKVNSTDAILAENMEVYNAQCEPDDVDQYEIVLRHVTDKLILKLKHFCLNMHPDEYEAQAEVTVDPSSQDNILNEKTEQDTGLLRSYDFKPMISMRDYLRRVSPCRTLRFNPDLTNNGVFQFNIKDFLYTPTVFGSMTPLRSLMNMYWGFSGGLKIRLIVESIDATDTPRCALYYVPPGFTVDTTGLQVATTYPGSFANNAQALLRYSFEAGTNATGYMLQEVPSNSTNSQSLIFEFEIPNMSPYRFLASLENYSDASHVAPGELGHFLLCVAKPYPQDLNVRNMIGFTDETRFGYQSIPSRKTLNTYDNGAAGVIVETLYNYPTNPFGPPTSTAGYPGSYFRKT